MDVKILFEGLAHGQVRHEARNLSRYFNVQFEITSLKVKMSLNFNLPYDTDLSHFQVKKAAAEMFTSFFSMQVSIFQDLHSMLGRGC